MSRLPEHSTTANSRYRIASELQYPTIVVDLETSGLAPHRHVPVEVAWWHLQSGERGCFVPAHSVSRVLEEGEPQALEINSYRERLQHAKQDDGTETAQLENLLFNSTLAGSNPAFDAQFLATHLMHEVWHHRLWDLSSYAMGRLNLKYQPGLSDVCKRLGIPPGDHTATGDVTATGECFLELLSRP